jgi:hypothetical protein
VGIALVCFILIFVCVCFCYIFVLVRMGLKTAPRKVSAGKLEERRTLGRPKRTLDDNIKINVK